MFNVLKKSLELTNSDLIAIGALAVSVFAFGVAIWQLRVSQKHNRISVEPHLYFDETPHWKNDSFVYTLLIRNGGIGPARITDLYFCEAGKRLSFPSGTSDAEQVVASVLKDRFPFHVRTVTRIGQGMALSSNASLVVMEVVILQALNDAQIAELRTLATNLSTVVSYKTAYLETRTLTFPSRNQEKA
jgi:hypothetical protein